MRSQREIVTKIDSFYPAKELKICVQIWQQGLRGRDSEYGCWDLRCCHSVACIVPALGSVQGDNLKALEGARNVPKSLTSSNGLGALYAGPWGVLLSHIKEKDDYNNDLRGPPLVHPHFIFTHCLA